MIYNNIQYNIIRDDLLITPVKPVVMAENINYERKTNREKKKSIRQLAGNFKQLLDEEIDKLQ